MSKFCKKFSSLELKFSQNLKKLGVKCIFFSSKNVSGVSGAENGLEMVGIWNKKN